LLEDTGSIKIIIFQAKEGKEWWCNVHAFCLFPTGQIFLVPPFSSPSRRDFLDKERDISQHFVASSSSSPSPRGSLTKNGISQPFGN
jgi:hypothetical protein